jgi:thymidylate synthase ThyX
MKVTMIDYTGACSPDPWYAARLLIYAKNTRLEQDADTRARIQALSDAEIMDKLEEVANSVRTSWEFCEYKLQISGVTRALTHQLVRTRFGVAFAQQSMRSVDMTGGIDTRLPHSIIDADEAGTWLTTVQMIASIYKSWREKGIPTQDCRGILPTNILTNIFAKFDLRCIADICGKRENLRAQDEFGEMVRMIRGEIYAVHPWAKMFIEPERTATPAIDDILRKLLDGRSPAECPEINKALKELDKVKAIWG